MGLACKQCGGSAQQAVWKSDGWLCFGCLPEDTPSVQFDPRDAELATLRAALAKAEAEQRATIEALAVADKSASDAMKRAEKAEADARMARRHLDEAHALADRLAGEATAAEAERGEAVRRQKLHEAALASIAPYNLPFQRIAHDEHGNSYPQFGIVNTWSPFIISEPRPDGICEVNSFKYDEDSERGELTHVGYFVTDEYFCDEEDKLDAVKAERDEAQRLIVAYTHGISIHTSEALLDYGRDLIEKKAKS